MKSLFEEMGSTYSMQGNCLLPNLPSRITGQLEFRKSAVSAQEVILHETIYAYGIRSARYKYIKIFDI